MRVATDLIQVTAWKLHFADGNSDKFYHVYALANGTLILHWGRAGTSGQTKIENYTPDEAQIIAKRQVYAKAGKGYKMEVDAFAFTSNSNTVSRVQSGWGAGQLGLEMNTALKENQFTQQQRLVTTHYDTFIEQTSQVLDAAAKGEDFDALLEHWQRLSEAWSELDSKHQHAQTAVNLVQQVVGQAMMKG